MRRQTIANRPGFALIELIIAMVMAIIVVFGIGVVLVDNQRGWHRMYNRVYGDVVTDGYVAKRAFDAVVRKSSVNERRPTLGETGEYAEVYYYQDSTSAEPDRYARFYTDGDELLVDHGELDTSTGYPQPASSKMTLARNVTNASFSVFGTSVRMILDLDNSSEAITLTCSAVRHNK